MPPETIKIITKDHDAKFSPFEVFKKDPHTDPTKLGQKPDVREIIQRVIDQQIAITRFFASDKSAEKIKELSALNVDELIKNSEQDIKQYLHDLAFLVVTTKDERKIDYLEYLLELGVDPNETKNVRGEKLFLITEACAAGNVAMVEKLINEYEDQLTKRTDSGLTLLAVACSKGQCEMVEYLLTVDPEQIRSVDHNGSNVLHHAAVSGNLELFKFLLAKFEELGIEDFANKINKDNRRTPTDEAICKNHLEITQLAIQQGLLFNAEKISEKDWLQKMMAVNPPAAVEPSYSCRANGGVEEGKGAEGR
jgi:ankyrin repeat protein